MVRDIAEFLAELGPAATGIRCRSPRAYHDACHLAHDAADHQGTPRDLLRAIPELTLGRGARRGHLLRFGMASTTLRPWAASEWRQKGRIGAVHRGPAADLGQPGLLAQTPPPWAESGQDIAVAQHRGGLDASIRGRPLLDYAKSRVVA